MSLTEQVCWENLFHEIRDRAEPVYAFDANGLLSAALKYRGRKLFDRNATLLWREPTHSEEDDELDTTRYLEMWLLEDMTLAVTSCFQVEQTEGALWVRYTIAAQYLVDQTTLVETVADAYAPGRELNMETKTLEAPAILEKRTETVSSEANLQMDGVQADDILFLPDFPRQYREEGGIALEIPGTVQLLCQGPDGALRAVSSRWEGKLTRPTGEDAALTALPATPPAPQMTVSGGKATLRAELPLSLTTTGGQGIPMVTALALGEDTQPDPQRPSLILRRAGTDSLWELAKATGSTVAAIRCVNKLQDEPGPNQILLIPVS